VVITYRLIVENEPKGQIVAGLQGDLGPLLRPQQLLSAADILTRRVRIPAESGIYGWWFNSPIEGVPVEDALRHQSHHLLYVGIAPRQPSTAGKVSRSTLRRRITRDHLGHRIGSSTLRRSLAYLLKDSLQLEINRTGKKDTMPRHHELILTRWMREHASLSFMLHTAAWKIEQSLVRCPDLTLPLNIQGSPHPFSRVLGKMR
jgi:hypothetical protein